MHYNFANVHMHTHTHVCEHVSQTATRTCGKSRPKPSIAILKWSKGLRSPAREVETPTKKVWFIVVVYMCTHVALPCRT